MQERLTNLFIETELNSWEQVFGLNYKFLNQFYYRGQPRYEYPILSSLERAIYALYPNLVDTDEIPSTENEMLMEFKWKFPLYGINPPPHEDNVEWLAIMQHYGAPTRLIDITKSFYIASHFATSHLNIQDSAVWAFNRSLFSKAAFADYRKAYNTNVCGRDDLYLHSNKLANQSIGAFYKKADPFSLLIVNPQRVNERILNQQAMFIMQSDIKRPFQEHMDSLTKETVQMNFADLISYSKRFIQSDAVVIKIKIPNKIAFDVRDSLKTMNISSESLFPGVEGMAKSLFRHSWDTRR
jgi:hypothetical protein